jgi:hypothetical protein
VTLPFDVSSEPVPPVTADSAAASSAIVETSLPPVPKVMVVGGFAPMVMVSVWPAATALWVKRFMGFWVPTAMPNSLSKASVLPPPMAIAMSASAEVSTSRFEAFAEAVTPVAPVSALILAWIVAKSSVAAIAMVVPLITISPPTEDTTDRSVEPVNTATASGDRVAPVPVIVAGEGAPASGLAEKFAGLRSSDPGTWAS